MKKITIIFFVLFIASTKVVVQVRAVANNYNLSVASSSNVRFYDGTSPTGVIGANEYASVITDINNNGKPDIIIGNYAHSNNGRSASGSVYVIYDDKFASLHGTNNNIDFTSPSVYSVRFDGATANEELSDGGVFAGDVTGDGKTDI